LCNFEPDQWFKLTNDLGEETQWLIGLDYEIKGPGKDKCPLCGIFIGEEPCVYLYSEIIHQSCLCCMDCGKNKPSTELIFRNGRYYDSVCFERRFGSSDASTYLSKFDLPHNWTSASLNFTNLFCSHCSQSLRDIPSRCQECSFTCHSDCKPKALSNCISKIELEPPKASKRPIKKKK